MDDIEQWLALDDEVSVRITIFTQIDQFKNLVFGFIAHLLTY